MSQKHSRIKDARRLNKRWCVTLLYDYCGREAGLNNSEVRKQRDVLLTGTIVTLERILIYANRRRGWLWSVSMRNLLVGYRRGVIDAVSEEENYWSAVLRGLYGGLLHCLDHKISTIISKYVVRFDRLDVLIEELRLTYSLGDGCAWRDIAVESFGGIRARGEPSCMVDGLRVGCGFMMVGVGMLVWFDTYRGAMYRGIVVDILSMTYLTAVARMGVTGMDGEGRYGLCRKGDVYQRYRSMRVDDTSSLIIMVE
ncbi:hypothetical protein Tco_1002411 [Tanacetum coccineum]|uniref:Uncharacterized protein n=1 Tax=Tanacetum coccineum TaxID=301880 RepID=A0ABQ5F7N6_9ASTR